MYSLLTHNTFGLSVHTARFFEYSTVEELLELIQDHQIQPPFLHIGGGSNLLFTRDYEGTILHSAIRGIEIRRETDTWVEVRVGAGVVWDEFVAYCVENEWYGAENLSLIPGEVGASAVQNIGAYGVEAKDLIVAVETIDVQGKGKVYTADECQYAYRGSIFKQPEMKSVFITYVIFRLSKLPVYRLEYGTIRQELEKYADMTLAVVRQTIIDIRKSKLPDPKDLGNAGSFFMNPIVGEEKFKALLTQYPDMPHYPAGEGKVKIPAGWMIDRCGWRGKSLGPAGVYAKQALVLVNLGGATGKDIVALSDAVRASVRDKFGIEIYPEVNFI